MTITATVTKLVSDEGTVVVFDGRRHDNDRPVRFAADARPAQDIYNALAAGHDDVEVELESWQIIG